MTTTAWCQAKQMLDALRSDPHATRQFLLLSHLYARTDSGALAAVRAALQRPNYSAAQVTVGVVAAATAAAGVAAAAREPAVAGAVAGHAEGVWGRLGVAVPFVHAHPRLCLAAATGAHVGHDAIREGRSCTHARAWPW